MLKRLFAAALPAAYQFVYGNARKLKKLIALDVETIRFWYSLNEMIFRSVNVFTRGAAAVERSDTWLRDKISAAERVRARLRSSITADKQKNIARYDSSMTNDCLPRYGIIKNRCLCLLRDQQRSFELMSAESLHIIADKHRHGNFRTKHSEVEVNHEASRFSSRRAVWRIHCRNFHNRRL